MERYVSEPYSPYDYVRQKAPYPAYDSWDLLSDAERDAVLSFQDLGSKQDSWGEKVVKGDLICEWDAYNAITIIETAGKVRFDSMIDGVTFREEMADEYSLNRDKVKHFFRDIFACR